MASYEQRGKSTRVIVRLPGGGKKTATFDTLREAKAWGQAMERKKTVEGITAGCGVKVSEMFETYLDLIASKTDGAKWNKLRLTMVARDPLGDLDVTEVITHDINSWIARRASVISPQTGKVLAPGTVNRELNLISGAFTWAVKVRKWIKENPCHGAARLAGTKARNRDLLTKDEIVAIHRAFDYTTDDPLTSVAPRVCACFLFALETGMRSGEILRLTPKDYIKEDRIIHVTAAEAGGRKGSRSGHIDASRIVPLTVRAMEILDQLLQHRPKSQAYIVGISDEQRDANWRKHRDRSGVKDLTFHDSKHEAATKLCRFLDVIALSHAIGTKNLKLLRDTYYNNDAKKAALLLPESLNEHS